jgi:hypothetical protein
MVSGWMSWFQTVNSCEYWKLQDLYGCNNTPDSTYCDALAFMTINSLYVISILILKMNWKYAHARPPSVPPLTWNMEDN